MSTHIGRSPRSTFAHGLLALAVVTLSTIAKAAPVDVADTGTPVPNGVSGETFANGMGLHPGDGNGSAVLLGAGNKGTSGLYLGNGGPLSIVADTNTLIPGSASKFTSFADGPSISGSNVSFNPGDSSGVYAKLSGTLTKIADTSTAIPSGFGNFVTMTNSSISGSNVAFSATGSLISQFGVYSSFNAGSLNVIANGNTTTPVGGTFTGFRPPSISGTNVVFVANTNGTASIGLFDSATGITGGSITALATSNTPVPNGTGNFGTFGRLSLSGANVAFIGADSTFTKGGIYSDLGGTLGVVADSTTHVPGGGASDTFFSSTFINNSAVSISGSDVAFIGQGSTEFGIYVSLGGVLSKVITNGDTISGKSVTSLSMFSNSLDGSSLAFYAQFADGSAGIFVTSLPEPTTAAVIGLIALPALLTRRRNDTIKK